MKTVSSLLDEHWYERYKKISRLNIRSSIYDVTDRCNLRCKGCFFFSSGEHERASEENDIDKWHSFVEKEMDRGVNLAILIGGEPTLCLDRIEAFYKRLPTFCATNGLIKVPRDRFPDMMVGLSLWGDEEDEKALRGKDTFKITSANYAGDPHAYYLYTITPKQLGKTDKIIQKVEDIGLKVHMQLLSNDESVDGFSWKPEELVDIRAEMDAMLDAHPKTVVSSKYYHKVITTGEMLDRKFGWMECPSVTDPIDKREPRPKRLTNFIRWASDLETMHRCCTSETRDCSTCKDGAAHMSWVMVNKRAHIQTTEDLQNWIEVYEMFAKLYQFIPLVADSMECSNPVIIGYDAISPLGIDLENQWQRALHGESGIGPLTRFPLQDDFPVRIAGQAADIDDLPYPFLTARHQASWSSPIFKYGMLSVARALERSGLEISQELAPRVAVTYSSAIGGLDAVLNADRRMQSENKLPPPYANPNACINMVGGKIAIQTGAQGPIVSTITACATGLTSMITGAMFLAQNRADVVICGAVDFALVEPIVAGFHTMNGAYNPKEGQEHEPPQTASRPFSTNRRGFVISEGAGAVILASREFAESHGLPFSTELAGWGMTSDAHHFVAPHFPTIKKCMQDAINDAGITPADIAAVNAHAASTRVGDKVEFDAIEAVFGGRKVPVTANKSLIGHAMGASSVIESIFTLRGMQESILPPTINYQADPEIDIDCVSGSKRELNQEYVLKNSFGFGGCNSCAVFRRLN